MATYLRFKTVRFEEEIWMRIEAEAQKRMITTSEYIRDRIEAGLPEVML